MALLVKNTKFKNTEILTPEIYVRIQYVALSDGKKTNVTLLESINKNNFLNNNFISTDLPKSFTLNMLNTESQDLLVIHNKVKNELELLNFIVTIDL
jgi:hypothetical protein